MTWPRLVRYRDNKERISVFFRTVCKATLSMTAHPTAALTPPHSQSGSSRVPPLRDPAAAGLIKHLIRERFSHDPEFLHGTHVIGPGEGKKDGEDLHDFVFLGGKEAHSPKEVFERLRWGGQLIYVSEDWGQVNAAAHEFAEWRGDYVVEKRPATVRKYRMNWRWMGVSRKLHYFAARKVMLVEPGHSSDRFTYHVFLEKNRELTGGALKMGEEGMTWRDEYDVVKQVPATERVLARLKEKFPEADEETLRRRSKKFTDKIFPVFLTREAAILKLLQRDLPKQFRDRVPRVLEAEQDLKGYVHTLRMNWLRNGGKPLSQLEFAKQAAELLAALHDDAHVMHLDLRLDNVVITEKGVGFVDFGSAVRVGEAFPEASLLNSLFGEMMRTSQIQRMLGKMTESGLVTSEEICNSYHRIDKAVDFFYLAVQINAPQTNPDLRGLVKYDRESREAKELAKLTEEILRPADPEKSRFKSGAGYFERHIGNRTGIGEKVMNLRRLLIATTNAGKVVEIRHELENAGEAGEGVHGAFAVVGLKDIGGFEACVEDRETFVGNAMKKARHFAEIGGCLALADDSGLCVDALGGEPGVYSARYAGVEGHGADAANNAKLLEKMKDVPEEKRRGRFVCAMALAIPGANLAVMMEHVEGEILREGRGENGFGYDPLFYFPQFRRTTAELDTQSKSRISHRGKALRRMIAWMRENEAALFAMG